MNLPDIDVGRVLSFVLSPPYFSCVYWFSSSPEYSGELVREYGGCVCEVAENLVVRGPCGGALIVQVG
jgi:hypothetical protein